MALKIGDKAPDFKANDESGKTVSLADFKGKSPVVLYFYPKAETPGCTAEAKCFRDNWDAIKPSGAIVLGVSSDSEEKQKSFKEHHKLQFTLLSDKNKRIREAYDAKGFIIPARMTFVIDKEGIIRGIHNSQMDPKGHIDFAIDTLKEISSKQEKTNPETPG
jgi:peroxiredoxin Q/BCP